MIDEYPATGGSVTGAASTDRPIRSLDEDKFFRKNYAMSIVKELLLPENREDGLVIGVSGPWGSGKSSIIGMIRSALQKAPYCDVAITIDFNPWLVSDRADLITELFNLLNDEFKRIEAEDKGKPMYTRIESTYKEYEKHIGNIAEAVGGYFGGKKAGEIVSNFFSVSISGRFKEVKKILRTLKTPIIVLVDEIDRLTDDEIKYIAQLVKAVGDLPYVSYVLAYDPLRVAQALGGTDLDRGHSYLEKIVQLEMPLPQTLFRDLFNFLKEQLSERKLTPDQITAREGEDPWVWLAMCIPDLLSTPRDIKRMAAIAQIRRRMVAIGEVDSIDLLVFCAFDAKIPMFTETVKANLEYITIDGSRKLERRQAKSRNSDEIIKDLLGPVSRSANAEILLRSLFPALHPWGSEFEVRADTRLCYRTPLLTMLHCDDLRDTASIKECNAALTDDGALLNKLLLRATSHGMLRQANLRLRHLFLEKKNIEETENQGVWKTIGKFFDREIDVTKKLEDEFVEVTHVWVRGIMRHSSLAARYKNGSYGIELVQSLLDQACPDKGEGLHLVSTILHFHFRGYGLFGFEQDETLNCFLSKGETIDLSEKTGKIIKKHARMILPNLRNTPPLLVAVATENWVPPDYETFSDEEIDKLVVFIFRNAHKKILGTWTSGSI